MIELNVTNKDFLDEVASYVRGESSQDVVDYFQCEDNIHFLLEGLIVLKKNVESQLAGYKSRTAKRRFELMLEEDDFDFGWSGYLAENADWRAKAIKFINSIECYIKHTKSMISEYNSSYDQDQEDDEFLNLLIAGIIDKMDTNSSANDIAAYNEIIKVAQNLKSYA